MHITVRTMADVDGAATIKEYSLDECLKHNTEDSCWLIIDGKVYDVTPFLDEHPGGYDIIITNTGKDATEDFEEIGHSNAAKEMLDKYLIGDFEGGAAAAAKLNKVQLQRANPSSGGSSPSSGLLKALLPLLVILVAVWYAMNSKR